MTACSGSEEPAAPRPPLPIPSTTFPTTATTLPPSTTTTNPDQPVLLGLEAYRKTVLQAFDPQNPSHPGLTQVSTGSQLESWRRGLAAGQAKGESLRGPLEFRNVRVLERDQANARVEVCIGDGLSAYGPDGTAVRPASRVKYEVGVMTLTVEDGRWKVSGTRNDNVPCSP